MKKLINNLTNKNQSKMEFLMYKTKGFMLKNSKSQAAMEFLMTYGWALLVVLIAIAALAFFGLLNPSRFLPEKADLGPGLVVQGAVLNEDKLMLIVYNGLGQTLRDFSIEIDDCTNGAQTSDSVTFTSGSTQRFDIYCKVDSAVNSRARFEMQASYTTRTGGHELSHSRRGEVSMNVDEGLRCHELTGEWILVPGNPTLYGTDDFCVMKWEAKNVGGVATSQAVSLPWENINQNNAKAECEALGSGFKLISNEQWMTIARNIEQVPQNWNSTTVGEGGLYRGNTGGSTDLDCDSGDILSGDDGGVCNTAGERNKRMLYLSNGEDIWDFSGNVWEWVDETVDCSGEYPCDDMPMYSDGWYQFNDITDWGAYSRTLLGPSNSDWNSNQGMGRIGLRHQAAIPSGNIHAFLRGGGYGDEDTAGVFALNLHLAPSYSDDTFGFRCSFSG